MLAGDIINHRFCELLELGENWDGGFWFAGVAEEGVQLCAVVQEEFGEHLAVDLFLVEL